MKYIIEMEDYSARELNKNKLFNKHGKFKTTDIGKVFIFNKWGGVNYMEIFTIEHGKKVYSTLEDAIKNKYFDLIVPIIKKSKFEFTEHDLMNDMLSNSNSYEEDISGNKSYLKIGELNDQFEIRSDFVHEGKELNSTYGSVSYYKSEVSLSLDGIDFGDVRVDNLDLNYKGKCNKKTFEEIFKILDVVTSEEKYIRYQIDKGVYKNAIYMRKYVTVREYNKKYKHMGRMGEYDMF